MNVVLVSTYELGHQPFGLASPAAWLRHDGARVTCLDLSQQALKDNEECLRNADLIAFYLPMHTATRVALYAISRVRSLNPRAHLCAYGLYAPLNSDQLRELGIQSIFGGEFEAPLAAFVSKLMRHEGNGTDTSSSASISLDRQQFLVPDRSRFPRLNKYAKLMLPGGRERVVGYTEASRGCKHLCRHCPVVPVYNGVFRIVQRDVVLADIRQQVEAGAEHISFGDPDFFNGIGHSLGIVRALHTEFPTLSYDVTIKIEHLLTHAEHLSTLRETGCAFVVSAVESFDDNVLRLLDKGHTRADFVEVLKLMREIGVPLSPTFVAFTPWISLAGYEDFLLTLAELDLIENVQPIQLAIQLLIPSGSRLLKLQEVRDLIGPFDHAALCYRWLHSDARVDLLQQQLEAFLQQSRKWGMPRRAIFEHAWSLLQSFRRNERAADSREPALPPMAARTTIPYLTEPWYC
ncbi:MAG TPA: CUAEP/CCAEP-tail radical SAM protein [Terriglobales bacterium]|nr:CUAEP/CCAEP-tail radical SAM protein [Terriglobales bacterium]